ncbi:MAG TPA: hypothetical protein VF486_21015 [Actinomycetes bacterium]
MSAVTANPPTRTPTIRARHAAARTDRDRKRRHSRIWALLEALAYSSALVDPTGVLAAQRCSAVQEEHQHGGRR